MMISVQLVSLLLLVLLAEVFPFSIFSRTNDHPMASEEGDIPPHPKCDGSHMIHKLHKEHIDDHVKEWRHNSVDNIWELSGLREGDIMEPAPGMMPKNALRNEVWRWQDGVVPYNIHGDFGEEDRKLIRAVIDEFHNKTCVRFRPYKSGDQYFIQIKGDSPGCWSYLGRQIQPGGQVVNLQRECVQHGVITHELLHALAFNHQQSASNRDKFVRIHWQNIEDGEKNTNFKKMRPSEDTDFGIPYDYGSIMHYSSYAFSINGRPTITPLRNGVQLGQSIGLSDSDIKKLNIMYGCRN